MTQRTDLLSKTLARVKWPVTLTWAGLLAERLARAFWPLWSVVAASLGALMMGLQDIAAIEIVWGAMCLSVLGVLVFAVLGLRRFRWPARHEAEARIDAALPGRPLATLRDTQVIGRGDGASEILWARHRERMAQTAAQARRVAPDLKLSRQDPYGLRYIALLGLVVALVFGSFWKVGTVAGLSPAGTGAVVQGPSWEGWIEPPAYTGLPSLYLADQQGAIVAPAGSRVTLRFYGEIGALSLAETVSGRVEGVGSATDPSQSFALTRDGELRIDGAGGRAWPVQVLADMPPQVTMVDEGAKTNFDGLMAQPFVVQDDYGITAGSATFRLDLGRVDRRHGLATAPDARDPIGLDLPMPITGSRADFAETLIENLSRHPWAHLPVTLTLEVTDEAGQVGTSDVKLMPLPARRFFDPMAAAVIEMRRDLLWARANATRVTQVLRAVSYRPDARLFRDEGAYLRLRVILRRLETAIAYDAVTPEVQDETAQALWDLAIQIEDGDIGDALARMQAAQERLSEAMRNGASEDEIAQLMQELRDATQDFLRQQLKQAQQDNQRGQGTPPDPNAMQMTQQDLQDMMDRIQELMEQGRMAEAQQALEEFQRMMENMQVTEGQPGQGSSEGQQAMEGLADTLRGQQGLSDQAFRDLQEQFNPGAQAGQSGQNEGQSGGEGRGQSHDGTGGTGSGEGAQSGQGGQGGDQGGQDTLAQRQEALRQELERQRDNLPGGDGEAGQAARDALERAGRAMQGAEDALRNDDLAGAIDQQSQAMDALRDGMRSLGEALAENEGRNPGGQGQARGGEGQGQSDPLGREPGQGRHAGTQDNLLQGEDVYRRARELLDEIRQRSGEGERPEIERNYLRRLLDRF